MRLLRTTLLCSSFLAWALPSAAGPITTLYNTGVDASGTVLADGTIGDPHYTLIGTPGGTNVIRIITSDSGFPIPPYIGDNTSSRWIGPNNNPDLDGPVGDYTYRTTFDLTGFNAATASISGGWSSDNNGVRVLLNGANTFTPGTDFEQFRIGFAPFAINSGFVAGLNTLDFVVYNGGGPTALRVEMTGKAQVPDGGATLMMLGLAFAGLSALRRKF